jgi:hypothetical protein
MNRVKLILIASVFLLILILGTVVGLQNNAIKRHKAEVQRLSTNEKQLLADNLQIMTLNLKEKEVSGKLKRERDSLATSLKIKPKQIEKIIYIDNSTHDTVPVPVYISPLKKDHWILRDSSACWKYVSRLTLKGDSLTGVRELFDYHNVTTQTFYKLRPHKFLFIKWGKWMYFQKIDAACDSVRYRAFVFEK